MRLERSGSFHQKIVPRSHPRRGSFKTSRINWVIRTWTHYSQVSSEFKERNIAGLSHVHRFCPKLTTWAIPSPWSEISHFMAQVIRHILRKLFLHQDRGSHPSLRERIISPIIWWAWDQIPAVKKDLPERRAIWKGCFDEASLVGKILEKGVIVRRNTHSL